MPSKSLGYKIKYIDPLPGRKHKKALYEIKPGIWVSRAQVPGHQARHWPHNNKWNNSEYGYIMNLYSSALKEFKKGMTGLGDHLDLKYQIAPIFIFRVFTVNTTKLEEIQAIELLIFLSLISCPLPNIMVIFSTSLITCAIESPYNCIYSSIAESVICIFLFLRI